MELSYLHLADPCRRVFLSVGLLGFAALPLQLPISRDASPPQLLSSGLQPLCGAVPS